MEKLIYGRLMAKIYKVNILQIAKLYVKYSLAIFLTAMLYCCHQDSGNITLVYHDNSAVGIAIPKSIVSSPLDIRSIKVSTSTAKLGTAMLGGFVEEAGQVVFTPVVPLTPGLSYTIYENEKLIGKIEVPFPKGEKVPVVDAVYPESDTVPANLLKFYFQFSKPMQTGNALDHVYLLDEKGDTLKHIFLNLQPELWDSTGKILTIWIDPGRIKRDLVLNKRYGNPLVQNSKYQLVVSRKWKDRFGISLSKNYHKVFVAAGLDVVMPNIDSWQIKRPKANTLEPLTIDVNGKMDHLLLKESIIVLNELGEQLEGRVEVTKDRFWKFSPAKAWKRGHYQLKVDTRLEDLAANNLNRLFDRDLTKQKNSNNLMYLTKTFEVKD